MLSDQQQCRFIYLFYTIHDTNFIFNFCFICCWCCWCGWDACKCESGTLLNAERWPIWSLRISFEENYTASVWLLLGSFGFVWRQLNLISIWSVYLAYVESYLLNWLTIDWKKLYLNILVMFSKRRILSFN